MGYKKDLDVEIIAQIDFVHDDITKKDLEQFMSHLRYILQQRYPGKNFLLLPTGEVEHSNKCNCGKCEH